MLRDQIKLDLTSAQKAKDQRVVDTLRFLLGEIANLEIAKYPPTQSATLTDEDVISVISKQAKRHEESIDLFGKAGRTDLVEKETAELKILQSYLPERMSEDKVKEIVGKIVSENKGVDFGTLMKLSMSQLKGQADGSTVSKLLKELM